MNLKTAKNAVKETIHVIETSKIAQFVKAISNGPFVFTPSRDKINPRNLKLLRYIFLVHLRVLRQFVSLSNFR